MPKSNLHPFGEPYFCLIPLIDENHCEAMVFIRAYGLKTWHLYDSATFTSSGLAVAWARSIQADIEIVKVQTYERQ